MSLLDLDTEQFNELAQQVRKDYQDLQAKNLNLNLTRGKPSNARWTTPSRLILLR